MLRALARPPMSSSGVAEDPLVWEGSAGSDPKTIILGALADDTRTHKGKVGCLRISPTTLGPSSHTVGVLRNMRSGLSLKPPSFRNRTLTGVSTTGRSRI